MAKNRFNMLVAAAAMVTFAAPSLQAAEKSVMVKYSDLDLSTESGQAAFKSRILRAVRNVCTFPSSKTAYERLDQFKCEARAKTAAMTKAEKTIARYGGTVKVALD